MNHITKLINFKQQTNSPFMASGTEIITDMDTFPYPRFYRGVAASPVATVFDREAGWKQRKDLCYEQAFLDPEPEPKGFVSPPINYFSYNFRVRESEKLISGENLLKHR